MSLYPWLQACTLLSVILMVFLAALFLMSMSTLNYELGTAKGETAFQVYWRSGTDMALVQEHWKQMKNLPWFSGMKTFTPKEALRELDKRLQGKNLVAEKSFPFLAADNPLPATALLTFSPQETDVEAWIQEMEGYLYNLPGVERVLASPLKDELGQAWRKASRYVLWPALALLSLALGVLVANTVRLALYARAPEIEILQMVGAPNWYVRLPLLVNGAFIGFLGAALALVLTRFLHLQIRDVFNFPPLFLEIRFLPWSFCFALLLIPTCTAMVASYLAVRGTPFRQNSAAEEL